MKKIILLLTIAMIVTVNYSCNDSNASKIAPAPASKTVSKSTSDQLSGLGFSRSSTVLSIKASEESAKYTALGLKYLSAHEVEFTMQENNFIIGPASVYIGNIPEDAAKQILEVYEIVTENFPVIYIDPMDRKWTEETMSAKNLPERDKVWIRGNKPAAHQIFVVGPVDKFDTGSMFLTGRVLREKPLDTDPIALVKTEFGYVELARW